MKLKFATSLWVILLLFYGNCLSQNNENNIPQEKSEFWQRVQFGGGLGLGFANGFFSGSIAPTGIYNFNEQVALGVGLNATYNAQKDVYQSTILGGSVLSLFNIIPELQLSAEWEQLFVTRNFENNSAFNNENYWYPALFVGAGFRSQNIIFGVRYDLIYDEQRSIYGNAWQPFVRAFF